MIVTPVTFPWSPSLARRRGLILLGVQLSLLWAWVALKGSAQPSPALVPVAAAVTAFAVLVFEIGRAHV